MNNSPAAGFDPAAGSHAYVYNASNQVVVDTWAVGGRVFVKSYTWAGALKAGESQWGEIVIKGSVYPGARLQAEFLEGAGAVQWMRTPLAGGAAADIANATALDYIVKVSDRGYAITIRATAFSPKPVGAAVMFEPPGAPGIGAANGGDARVSAMYTAPADDGGSAVVNYDAQLLRNGTPAAFLGSVPNPVVFTSMQGVLNDGAAYTVRVRANNALGAGPYSPASLPVTPIVSGSTTPANSLAIGSVAVGSTAI